MNLSHKLTVLCGFLCLTLILQAQTPEKRIHHITASQAVELALKQRVEILNARLDVKNQAAYNKEITGLALPQVTGGFGMSRNFNIPVTVLADFISPQVYGVLENEDIRNSNGDPVKWDGIINTFPARFGVPWQATLQASVQQILFQPDVFVALKARSGAMELFENQKLVAEDSVKSNVYNAYFGVLVTEKALEFAKESQIRLEQLLKQQEQLFKNGFVEKLDLEKTQVNLNNVTTRVINIENTLVTSYAGLKFALALPQSDSLHLSDKLSKDWINENLFAMGEGFSYENRVEIKTLQSSEELQELQVKRFKMAALPSVTANWNLATSAQRNRFDFYDTKDRWFFSNILGINISVPLTDGFQRHNRVKQAQYALEKTRNNIDQFKQVIDFQLVNARTTLANSIAVLNNQEENKVLAEKVFQTTKIKYEQGIGSSFEVLQAENDLQTALTNYFQALYNAGLARISYQRALGKL